MDYLNYEIEERKDREDVILYIVVPCYNEEEVLPSTAAALVKKIEENVKKKNISSKSKVLFMDDGSKDKTWEIIKNLNNQNKYIMGARLSRNKGHQNALHAGLMIAKSRCDISISIDADLQDDVNVIDGFILSYYEGNEIVYGIRSDRTTDSTFKRNTANLFYKLMKLLGTDIVDNHADCRLMSKPALEVLSDYKEFNLFLRGMIPTIGFKTDTVEYVRNKREIGETKYPLNKMIGLALDGITSFSTMPIRIVTLIGIIVFVISITVLLYSFIRYLANKTVVGWTSTMFSIWFIGGAQLIAFGLIGEYIGKIYNEVKGRPKYIIEEILENKETEEIL